MSKRLLIAASVGVLVAAAVVTVAQAASGPPPPTSTNGNTVQLVASGMQTPTSFAFGGGAVFEGDGGSTSSKIPNGGIYVLKGGTATKLAGSPQFVSGLAWHSSALYISGGVITSSGAQFELLKWSGWNGTTFASKSVIWKAPKKLNGLNGIAFGPDGRLYVGVDVGLTDGNDHGPAKTPYVYDILSFKANGKGLKVYATGIRQPWQFAFAPGSSTPLVSDLGQDSGAKNPPDFLLNVKPGDNYGFPKCNWTSAKACKGDAKPFKMFKPHTDIMGLAVLGKTLYMSSFLGTTGKAGEVFQMPVKGGAYKPLVSGFVAPVVGLGESGGYLYIGELTGQVFRVKI